MVKLEAVSLVEMEPLVHNLIKHIRTGVNP